MEKDNGYVENAHTGEVAEAVVDATGEKKSGQQSAPTELGKFKDVDALQRAYDCLQAEFTRRSQKLKALEKQVENFIQSEKKREALTEKLRSSARKSRAEKDAFDGFVSELEKVNVGTFENGKTDGEKPLEKEKRESADTVDGQEIRENLTMRSSSENEENAQNAEKSVPQAEGLALASENGEGDVASRYKEASVAARERETLSTEELYEKASRDEQVRLKIIGEYLASVGKSGAPLSRGGTGTLAAPIRAKSVQEAGVMALRFLKERGTQA